MKLTTTPQRSAIMSRIRGKNTGPEVAVRQALRRIGITRYRIHVRGLPGTPDIVIVGILAVHVNGCFWHGCPRHFRGFPKNNAEFWRAKLLNGWRRERNNRRRLNRMGLSVMVVWEHDVDRDPDRVARRIAARLDRVLTDHRKKPGTYPTKTYTVPRHVKRSRRSVEETYMTGERNARR